MRIATWNLDRYRPGSPQAVRVLEWMNRVGADVWVLTETDRRLTPGPEYNLIVTSTDAPDRTAGPDECWVAIWSRRPAESVELTADRERVAAARLVASGVVVVGTVLPWLTDNRHPGVSGAAAFRARLGEQAVDWLRLRRETSGGLCVAGDFNQDSCSSGYYYGSTGGRAALTEVLIECGLDCLTGGADDPVAGRNGRACVDHIAVAGRQAVGHPRRTIWPAPGGLPRNLSDHYGVWVDLATA